MSAYAHKSFGGNFLLLILIVLNNNTDPNIVRVDVFNLYKGNKLTIQKFHDVPHLLRGCRW